MGRGVVHVGLDRRAFLLGTAGLVLAGCSEQGPRDPVIIGRDEGTVVSSEDAAALAERLTGLHDARDPAALAAALQPAAGESAFVERWARRFAAFETIGAVTGAWLVAKPAGRTRNASGGRVEYRGDLVFAHRIEGCDARPVVETYPATFRKRTPQGDLEVLDVGEPEQYFDPSIWDLARIDVIETEHTYIAFRPEEAQRARSSARAFESGAARAFDLVPTPEGVRKVFVGLTWPAVQDELWGGTGIAEPAGNAYTHAFLDPRDLARGQETTVVQDGAPRATGRIGIHEVAFGRNDLADLMCHETAHVLASQWGPSGQAPQWSAEGFAQWAELPDPGALLARHGSTIRSVFPAFRAAMNAEEPAFYGHPRTRAYYLCGAAVFAFLDAERGRDSVFSTVQAHYGGRGSDGAGETPASPEVVRAELDALLDRTQQWLRA